VDPILNQKTLVGNAPFRYFINGKMEFSVVGNTVISLLDEISDLHGSENGDSEFLVKTPCSITGYH
jgi:hypothetical protein